MRFPRVSGSNASDTRERGNTIPGSGPSPSTERLRRTSPDLEVRRGEGQAEWRSRTVTREDLLERYRPGDESRGKPSVDVRTGSNGSRHERSNLSEARREVGRPVVSKGGGNEGAPGSSRGRTENTPPDRDGRSGANGPPASRDDSVNSGRGPGNRGNSGTPDNSGTRDGAGRGSSNNGSGGNVSRGAPTREAFRDLPPVKQEREVVGLPRRDLGKARVVRDTAQVISNATNLGMRVATASMIGITSSSCHGWSPYLSYGCSWGGGPAWSGCASWWWGGSHCDWWWGGSPCWGFGWTWGWGYCWRSYWDYCGYYYWWYPPYYETFYLAPPAAAYSTIVYETVEYADEAQAAEPVPVDTGEDVQATGAAITQGEGSMSIEREQELNRAADYYLTLGDRAFREGRYGDAVHYYAKAVEFSSQDGILYLILSDALFATGDYHYAAFSLRKALELDPALAQSVVDKHSFYSDPAEFDRQLAILERYLEDHFEDDDARLVLAANYLFGNRPAAAVDLLASPFSTAVAGSPAGRCLREAAKAIQFGDSSREPPAAEPKESKDGAKETSGAHEQK